MTIDRSIDATKLGLAINACLAIGKISAGVLGHSYALIADGIESTSDIVSSLFVWSGLRIAASPPDDGHPFGHGKAESIAAAAVSLLLLGMSIYTADTAVRNALVPHPSPASFTLLVLAAVIIIKLLLFRRVSSIGDETGSHVVKTDAWHHRSDVISSSAAFIGISIAIAGGPGWESADDWAALIASIVIGFNAIMLFVPALHELMDRAPDENIVNAFRQAALSVDEVQAVEKLRIVQRGTGLHVDIHIQMDGTLSLDEAHQVSGKVKRAFRSAVPSFSDSSIHMEPLEEGTLEK